MGWRSGWLHQLVFQEVKKIWQRAKNAGTGKFGPPPDALHICEMSDGDWERPQCSGDALRRWLYQGDEPELVGDCADVGELRGMFFQRGIVQFFIDPDRKRVLFTYILGPRYGRGMLFEVGGQGAQGKLTRCPGPAWIS